jgi:hypothetical protein
MSIMTEIAFPIVLNSLTQRNGTTFANRKPVRNAIHGVQRPLPAVVIRHQSGAVRPLATPTHLAAKNQPGTLLTFCEEGSGGRRHFECRLLRDLQDVDLA